MCLCWKDPDPAGSYRNSTAGRTSTSRCRRQMPVGYDRAGGSARPWRRLRSTNTRDSAGNSGMRVRHRRGFGRACRCVGSDLPAPTSCNARRRLAYEPNKQTARPTGGYCFQATRRHPKHLHLTAGPARWTHGEAANPHPPTSESPSRRSIGRHEAPRCREAIQPDCPGQPRVRTKAGSHALHGVSGELDLGDP
jgi:hypothetical protein